MFSTALFGPDQVLAHQRQRAFVAGLRAVGPAMVATAIWALVTGVAMVKLGMSSVQAIGMSLLVYAGSAQLAALPLIAAAAPIWVILLTAAVVNLRFVIFGAALVPYFGRFSRLKRAWLGSINTDMGFAIFVARYSERPLAERGSTEQVWFYIGAAAGGWSAWQVSSIVGILLATQVPTDWGLDFTAIVALIALTVPMINTRPALVGALVSGAVAVLARSFPLRLGLLFAVVVGMIAAMSADILLERFKATR